LARRDERARCSRGWWLARFVGASGACGAFCAVAVSIGT
jgi:hypothetical protein